MKSFWEEKGKIDGELARRVSLSVFFTFAVSGQMHRHVGDTTFSQKRQLIALRPLSSSAGRALGVRNPATPTQALLLAWGGSPSCCGVPRVEVDRSSHAPRRPISPLAHSRSSNQFDRKDFRNVCVALSRNGNAKPNPYLENLSY